ncbi:MAG: site-specific DNA-methyltransferase, partial [Planctomycetes bacterium]|nr:site-specific DNA-methyltransferase [Planctomycetota bacterium]
SDEYVKQIRERLATITEGDPLVGPEDPLSSAPQTKDGRRRDDKERPPRRTARARDDAPQLFDTLSA